MEQGRKEGKVFEAAVGAGTAVGVSAGVEAVAAATGAAAGGATALALGPGAIAIAAVLYERGALEEAYAEQAAAEKDADAASKWARDAAVRAGRITGDVADEVQKIYAGCNCVKNPDLRLALARKCYHPFKQHVTEYMGKVTLGLRTIDEIKSNVVALAGEYVQCVNNYCGEAEKK